MIKLFLVLFLVSFSAFAEEAPLTFEQHKAEREFSTRSKTEGWTFTYDVRQIGKWATGYVRSSNPAKNVVALGEGERLKSFNLSMFGKPLTRILNQGSCGSCVVFSFIRNIMDSYILRGLKYPELSPQHLMNCGTGGQCSGADGEGIAGDAVRLKTFHTLKDYPYTASSGRCRTVDGERYGGMEKFETLDGSHRSMLAALHRGQPISVGVAANGDFSSYRGGRYNACSSFSTNHYVVIQGIDCGKSVDKDGYCVFDEKGMLPAGVGDADVVNSWSESYGDHGHIKMALTDSRGRPCNNLAGERGDAQILYTGFPMPPVNPVTFVVENDQAKLTVTVQPEAKASVEEVRAEMENVLNSVGE